ncbi:MULTISPECIES: CPBP family intramembrane glutamic endopeptidase [Peptoniphilus]|uniref:CPBP family intramembrane glutamic endopeptidase n=1 Tax=Peptoniphilus TaxID=162289 RepID=UPI0001DA9C27|nr:MULTISPECIES: CPBP family intramembrane glutamic endopeptidase [Peptoniphilus]EFI42407.1 CAAX amino terminal protease family protein [Peptoniphilus sp. oral taxon 386 str. F0131]
MKSKKSLLQYIFIILFLVISYDLLLELFFAFYFYGKAALFGENFKIFNDGDFFLETLSCIIPLIVYSVWFFALKKNNDDKVSFEESVISKIVKCSIITFGLGGISSLWLEFVDRYLYKISIFKNSYDSFNDTWSGVVEEPYIFVFLSVVILGPIVEELLFRGLIYNYSDKIKSKLFPVIVSALLFGIWHRELVQSVYTISLGFGIALVYKDMKSLIWPIYVHILNNFISSFPDFIYNDAFLNAIDYLSFIMIIPTFYFMYKMIKRMYTQTSIQIESSDTLE